MLSSIDTQQTSAATATAHPDAAAPGEPAPTGARPARGDAIEIVGVSRVFHDGSGLHPTDLTVHAGEFLSVLGPSGCGKSTLLRCVAGLETPDRGRIAFGERTVFDRARGTSIAPRARRLGMVFQDLALWPHLSAAENVAFPLRVARTAKREVTSRVTEALDLVGLSHFATKMPHQLSGGQQQRVAIARAIVARPSVLLMDEPFSALDAALRLQLRDELRGLTTSLGLTTIYVTHDQSDAMAMSDRIAVLDRGVLKQVSSPEALYLHPHDAFVANFIGRCNWLPGEATVGVRPEHVTVASADGVHRASGEGLSAGGADGVRLHAVVTACAYTGGSYSVTCELTGAHSPWVFDHHARLEPGAQVHLDVAEERLIRLI